jgi:hypothetical protein
VQLDPLPVAIATGTVSVSERYAATRRRSTRHLPPPLPLSLAVAGVALAVAGVALAVAGVALAVAGVALAVAGVALAVAGVALAVAVAVRV